MVGAFAVGKTSLVQRFVDNIFSDRYLTTIGVKISKKELQVDGKSLQILLWDIQGEDELSKMHLSYLRGASAIVYVVDGTRSSTLQTALSIKNLADETAGSRIPCVFLFNKSDLSPVWELTDDDLNSVSSLGLDIHRTSARDGEGVENAFLSLSRLVLSE